MEVSSIEAIPVSEPEGRIARRGAVRAALKAGDFSRAHALADAYIAAEVAPNSLKTALRKILEDDRFIKFPLFNA